MFQLVERASLSSNWFQISTCAPTTGEVNLGYGDKVSIEEFDPGGVLGDSKEARRDAYFKAERANLCDTAAFALAVGATSR